MAARPVPQIHSYRLIDEENVCRIDPANGPARIATIGGVGFLIQPLDPDNEAWIPMTSIAELDVVTPSRTPRVKR